VTLGYCLNVHPGETLGEVMAAFEGPVARVVRLAGDVGAGIYLADKAMREVLGSMECYGELASSIQRSGARVFTANAFPFGGFHEETVKRAVYWPRWDQEERLEFTCGVAAVLSRLLPRGARASISTLPVGFRGAAIDLALAGRCFAKTALVLEAIFREKEVDLALAIEPEPFCHVERSSELVAFLEEHVFSENGRSVLAGMLPGADAEAVLRRRVGACLDACHHAVVFEEIEDALAIYARAGVRVVKAQLSSALEAKSVEALAPFVEKRYLHQTFWKRGAVEGAEDLDPALERARGAALVRSHFHVPLAWEGEGEIGTTRPLLERALPAIARATDDLEVETYTWSVLPEETQARFGGDVSAMVAAEIAWVRSKLGPGPGSPM
jgi:hypothetical protein